MGPNEPISMKLESARIVGDLHRRIKQLDHPRRGPSAGEMNVWGHFFWGHRHRVGRDRRCVAGQTRTRCPAWPCPMWFEADWAFARPAAALPRHPDATGARLARWAATRLPPGWVESPRRRARGRVDPSPGVIPTTLGPESPVGLEAPGPWRDRDESEPWPGHQTFEPPPMHAP